MSMTSPTDIDTQAADKSGRFDWVGIYSRFADRLLDFEDDRPALIACVRRAFESAGMDLPTLEQKGSEILDICPFTVMALFNKQMKREKRSVILEHLQKELDLPVESPGNFDGIPLLNPQRATFYWFAEKRGENDIDSLWEMFRIAITYADRPDTETRREFIELYDRCIKQRGVKVNLSMGLYWIRPTCFLGLDKYNRLYLQNADGFEEVADELSKDVPDGEKYLYIIDQIRKKLNQDETYRDFVDLSQKAWLASKDAKADKKAQKKLQELEVRQVTVKDGVYTANIDITTEEWKQMLQDPDVFYPPALEMVLDWYRQPEHRGSNKDVMRKTHPTYKGTPYNGIVKSLGKRIIWFLRRFELRDSQSEGPTYWILPFEGWYGEKHFIWKLRDELVQAIEELHLDDSIPSAIESDEAIEAGAQGENLTSEPYTEADFLEEVYLAPEQFRELKERLLRKKNIILQGAPGVGKTYCAKRLAWAILGSKDNDRIEMVQFHPNYSYEDFMLGYRPEKDGFELRPGPFYRFCNKAEADPEQPYIFIIDELNRGNLSKIFGELFVLLEDGYRGMPLRLMHGDELFCIPKNLLLIGMMNTADRSLALVDYALRRRFTFFELEPAFDSDGFIKWRKQVASERLDRLVEEVKCLNLELESGWRIGHSFFCEHGTPSDADLATTVRHELIPLLREYWFDEPDRVKKWEERLTHFLQ